MGPDHYAAGGQATVHPGPTLGGVPVDIDLAAEVAASMAMVGVKVLLDRATVERDHAVGTHASALLELGKPDVKVVGVLAQPMDRKRMEAAAAALAHAIARRGTRAILVASTDDHMVSTAGMSTAAADDYTAIIGAAQGTCDPAAIAEAAAARAPGLDCTHCIIIAACAAARAWGSLPAPTCKNVLATKNLRLAACIIRPGTTNS